jgi:hypothetical protein
MIRVCGRNGFDHFDVLDLGESLKAQQVFGDVLRGETKGRYPNQTEA